MSPASPLSRPFGRWNGCSKYGRIVTRHERPAFTLTDDPAEGSSALIWFRSWFEEVRTGLFPGGKDSNSWSRITGRPLRRTIEGASVFESAACERDQEFESPLLQRRVRKPFGPSRDDAGSGWRAL
jgi:hypothetical protein